MSESSEIRPEDLSASDPLIPVPQAQITIEHHGNRFWAVYDGAELICVSVYKCGAKVPQLKNPNRKERRPAPMTRAEHRLHVRHIRIIYSEAHTSTKRNGREWYEREHTEARSLAKAMGLKMRVVSACLAVLSPRCQWPRVKSACRQLLSGEKPPGIFGHNLRKAAAILHSQNGVPIDPRTAPKTWAFWQNLWHPNDPYPVTLDSWRFRAHNLPVSVSHATYQGLADCYRSVAEELALPEPTPSHGMAARQTKDTTMKGESNDGRDRRSTERTCSTDQSRTPSRAALEAVHGQVWDTGELARDFEIRGFAAPLVVVTRKADAVTGSLFFQHSPRYYFNFQPSAYHLSSERYTGKSMIDAGISPAIRCSLSAAPPPRTVTSSSRRWMAPGR